jgi:hypothetical protein
MSKVLMTLCASAVIAHTLEDPRTEGDPGHTSAVPAWCTAHDVDDVPSR